MALPIIPWIGGKRRLAPLLLERFPAHTCHVEPFCGAAALFFAKDERSKVEVLNDINGDLVRLYRCLQHHLEEFVRQFRWALVSRAMFDWTRSTPPETLTDIQRAARFYYLQKLTFGGKLESQTFGTATTSPARLNLLRIEEELSAAHLRLAGVTVEHLPWQDCVRRYDRPHTLFFMDPPYWQTAGYGVGFGWDQYEQLAEQLASLKGRAIVTLNDHSDVRRAFAAFQQERVDISYTVGGGAKPAKRHELIIYSWDRKAGALR